MRRPPRPAEPQRSRLLAAGLAAWLAVAAAPAQPRPGDERSRAAAADAARELTERARAAAAEEQRLAEGRVDAAARLRTIETEVGARAAEVSALSEQRAAADAKLRAHAAALAPVLPLMERLALYPAETLLAVPAPPEDALRGLGILHGMAQTLGREAAGLQREQADLAARAAALEAALPKLREAEAAQASAAQGLDAQLATAHALRQSLEHAGAEAERRAAAEAAKADTIRAALGALEASRARAEAQARDDAARAERDRAALAAAEAQRREAALARPPGPGPEPSGRLMPPVAGAVIRSWGEPTDAGPSTGVSFRPAPGARVVAPCGGRVRFAGPFRSFGALIILDCGGGYAFVLAGLQHLDVPVGASVLPGEPIGAMPDWDAAAAGSRPALYLELRHDGEAVNPAPFLRGRS